MVKFNNSSNRTATVDSITFGAATDPNGCGVGLYNPTFSSLGLVVPPNGTAEATFSNVVHMSGTASNACQS